MSLRIRFLKEWDIEPDKRPVRDVWMTPAAAYPLSGHAGSCAKVLSATFTGNTKYPCDCGKDS